MKQPVERRLAAILAADVAGYSRLMGAEERGRTKASKRIAVRCATEFQRGWSIAMPISGTVEAPRNAV